ncbi:gamma-glutamylcyclotransferase family protein [Methylomagnum sp.]
MADTIQLFAYGTLQIPEVMRAVTGAEFPSQPARLEGYARYRLSGRAYPGLRREPGTLAEGLLYGGIDAEALRRLDAFEDDFYRRETLAVLDTGGGAVAAEVYVVPPAHYSLLVYQPWDLEEFRRAALAGFMARCREER